MESLKRHANSKIVIVGAGPAGSSLAIRLATRGFETTLLERERFPRQKLCGEFISPECLDHFAELGVLEEMMSAGGDRITQTRFFESGGKSVTVPSNWFGRGEFALSLSRAEMDHLLLQRAKEVGVSVFEETNATSIECDADRVVALHAKTYDGKVLDLDGDLFVDATGRARVITKLVERNLETNSTRSKPDLVGFKTHLNHADIERGVCEIYSFRDGYAGLSRVEDGKFNLCFLLKASSVRSAGGDADDIMRNVIRKNKRARVTLADVEPHHDWLAVSVDGFGRRELSPARNLFSVGDAASFIDPFTGSGMYMALQSSSVLADSIAVHFAFPNRISTVYDAIYRRTFSTRHRVCRVLRQTAFMPAVATAIVSVLSISSAARRRLAQSTRG